jgi:hypothetical protein
VRTLYTAFPHTPFLWRGYGYAPIFTGTPIFMGTVVFHMIFMGSCVDFIAVFIDARYP